LRGATEGFGINISKKALGKSALLETQGEGEASAAVPKI